MLNRQYLFPEQRRISFDVEHPDDPPVYNHNEQEPLFCSSARVSDYLALMVEQSAGVEEIELVRSLKRLKRLAELLATAFTTSTSRGVAVRHAP